MSGSEMFAYFADEFGMTANQVCKGTRSHVFFYCVIQTTEYHFPLVQIL